MPVRMKDVARDLNVSVVTVSKALRDQSDISTATKKRILKRAQELNYQPNWIARSLVSGRTHTIGLVVPDLMYSFFAEVARGLSIRVRPFGYQVVISISEENPTLECEEVKLLLARRVDGLVLASAQPDVACPELFQAIEECKVPYVLIDRKIMGLKANYVGVDDEKVGRMATEHLISCGCRHIAHIGGPKVSTALGRLEGYRKALAQHGLSAPPACVLKGGSEDDGGYQAMRRLLTLKQKPDGVFCFNDPVAAGAVKAILEAGLKVPQDIAVVGVGNVHYSDQLRVPLSTVDQNSSQVGQSAAQLLLHLIEKRSRGTRTVLLQPHLVVRESSSRNGASRRPFANLSAK
ncbi:MAG: LacI family DNA-binding transcriptional regulator [Bryobacteraceae bacterium]|jgi:LacI family transcriptional regulator, galactose operon repressor